MLSLRSLIDLWYTLVLTSLPFIFPIECYSNYLAFHYNYQMHFDAVVKRSSDFIVAHVQGDLGSVKS